MRCTTVGGCRASATPDACCCCCCCFFMRPDDPHPHRTFSRWVQPLWKPLVRSPATWTPKALAPATTAVLMATAVAALSMGLTCVSRVSVLFRSAGFWVQPSWVSCPGCTAVPSDKVETHLGVFAVRGRRPSCIDTPCATHKRCTENKEEEQRRDELHNTQCC